MNLRQDLTKHLSALSRLAILAAALMILTVASRLDAGGAPPVRDAAKSDRLTANDDTKAEGKPGHPKIPRAGILEFTMTVNGKTTAMRSV